MTVTAPTAPTANPAPGGTTDRSAARRTLLALLACMLAVTPLKSLVEDNTWLGEAWLTMMVVIVPAALLRLWRGPSALDVWPGVILLVPWLTWIYVPKHAWGHVLPTGATFGDISDLMDSLHKTTANEVAPIHSTLAVRLVICALLGLLAALIDLIAVVGRRGALAGVPLLVVYTVSGAVPRTPVMWVWFTLAAAGYLVLLGLDASDELRGWGRRVPRPGAARGRLGLAFSGQRIGIAATLVAIIVPLLLPAHPHNLLADAFRNPNGNGLGGIGAEGGGGSINPFVAMKGQLERHEPVQLMQVHIDAPRPVAPFYARVNVLDKFTGDGWTVSDHGEPEPVGVTSFGTLPITSEPRTVDYQAHIIIRGMEGNAPVFSIPRSVQGVDARTTWSEQDQLLVDTTVRSGEEIIETVAQPQPTVADLAAAPPATGPELGRYLALPAMPQYVRDLVARIVSGRQSAYEKARAIFDFFADPGNGFVYSLKTTKGDSGSDLVDFLQHRSGFCQQYAAAMGVMLRLADIPARIVLGYMHAPPNSRGEFTVTTFDAHAWVEAFFPGSGWIPFDPTPTAGLTGGRKSDLAWAPHVFSTEGVQGPTRSVSITPGQRNTVTAGPSATAPKAHGAASTSIGGAFWFGVAVLALAMIVAVPAAVRALRRRGRFARARDGDPDPLWAELSDTAVDLGYVWSPARTPRQVSAWLAPDAADTAPALAALAAAVERRRYAPNPGAVDTAELARGLQEVTDQLRSRRSNRVRWRARLLPASLGWAGKLTRIRGALRRRH